MKRHSRATILFTGLLLAAIALQASLTRQSAAALEEPSPAKTASPVVTESEVTAEKTDDGEPFQTRVFRVPGRDPQGVARLLTELFGDKVNVTVDDRSDSIIVRVARAKLASEVEFYLKEIDATVKRLVAEPVANRRLPPPTASIATVRPNLDPSDSVMDREAKQLAVRVRAAKEPEKSKLRAELELLTDKHFEHRQQQRAAEIKDLADRVDKLRVAHHRRQENKPDILKRRLADLLDEENELKWDEARLKPASSITPPKPEPQVPNLDGEWLVTLPAGFEFVGKIEKRPEGCWSFQEMRNLSGFYQIEGNTLKGVTTDKKEPRDYEWLILNDNVLVLTKAPQNIGSDYRGATLRRGVNPKSLSVRSQIPVAAEEINDTLWTRLGFKLAKMEPDEKLPVVNGTAYRGGLRVTELREKSPAVVSGIRQGDILVGLDVWETMTFENVRYILDHADVPSLKVIFLRGSSGKAFGFVPWMHQQTIHGELPVEGVPARLRP